ncbi:MAG: hypothetical protein LBI72_06485 [Flavobacteriaceae bacterium]|jgi:AraC-like DNA-binding protein|nr:hypothetical protein [Flavobacteriaceae bacterium]
MKLELFEEVQSTFAHFVRLFAELPKQGNSSSLAYQHYHFHNFRAMTHTLMDSLLHINYVQLATIESDITYATSFNLVVDSDCQIVRHLMFDKIDKETQRDILQVIQTEIKVLKKDHKVVDKYVPVVFNCLNRTHKLCSIYGTVYIDTVNDHFVFNLYYLKIQTTKQDNSLEFNYYLKDKTKHKNIYNQLIKEKNIDNKKLLSILEANNIVQKDFEENIQYFYGDNFESYKNKERLIKSLELLFFTDSNIKDIALQCGYTSPFTILRLYQQSNRLNNNAIIRYAY